MHFKPLCCPLVVAVLLLAVSSAGAQEEPELFNREALDGATGLAQADCHLRNMDLCYAGLMAAGAKPLPESSQELELRCDELKVAQLCLADYQARCSSQRDLASAMGLVAGRAGRLLKSVEGTGDGQGAANGTGALADFVALCEPSESQRPGLAELRQRLFKLANCINARTPTLKPCLMDLKTALQLFYEQDRKLPVRPTCCALSRFRQCARQAMDGACGLSSLEELESGLASVTGTSGRLLSQTMERACRGADQWQSGYCRELLPPAGMEPPQRRGRKASKLARALDLLSMAPAN